MTVSLALSLSAQAEGGAEAEGVEGAGRIVVDLELALLLDVSASVNAAEYLLQTRGLAAALTHPAVVDAVKSATVDGAAISVIQWADEPDQRVAIGWTLVRSERDLRRLAARVAQMPRLIEGGHTALGSAVFFGTAAITANRYAGRRMVIDVSGDGRANGGAPLRQARAAALASGITINGLAIENEIPQLGRYFRDYLIGGPGAFYLTVTDYRDFGPVIARKLAREIRSGVLARSPAAGRLAAR